jgi:hypothetical protein
MLTWMVTTTLLKPGDIIVVAASNLGFWIENDDDYHECIQAEFALVAAVHSYQSEQWDVFIIPFGNTRMIRLLISELHFWTKLVQR